MRQKELYKSSDNGSNRKFSYKKSNNENNQEFNENNNPIHGMSCLELLSTKDKTDFLTEELKKIEGDRLQELTRLLPLEVCMNIDVFSNICPGEVETLSQSSGKLEGIRPR